MELRNHIDFAALRRHAEHVVRQTRRNRRKEYFLSVYFINFMNSLVCPANGLKSSKLCFKVGKKFLKYMICMKSTIPLKILSQQNFYDPYSFSVQCSYIRSESS